MSYKIKKMPCVFVPYDDGYESKEDLINHFYEVHDMDFVDWPDSDVVAEFDTLAEAENSLDDFQNSLEEIQTLEAEEIEYWCFGIESDEDGMLEERICVDIGD